MKSEGQTLYIIGNGFDLFHGIASSYSNFGDYLRREHSDIYRMVEDYLHPEAKDFWATFEARLATLDRDALIEDASQFLSWPSANDDWTDSAWHDYQYEIQVVADGLSKGLHEAFSNWIRQVQVPREFAPGVPCLNLDSASFFINFNYTSTLASLYKIPKNQVLHIHGEAGNPKSKLILGHAWIPDEEAAIPDPGEIWSVPPEQQDDDFRIAEGNASIDVYFKNTFKSIIQ